MSARHFPHNTRSGLGVLGSGQVPRTPNPEPRTSEMPRPPRLHVQGALYVVSSRAMEGLALFRDERDYHTYLELLDQYQAQFGFKLFAYVLLPDQLHLCLELTNETPLSTIMHALNSRYTKLYCGRYSHTGHVFQERFKATVAEKAPWLLRTTAYLHTLPAHAGLADETSLVTYRWSSYPRYLEAGTAAGPALLDEVAEVKERLARERSDWSYEFYVQDMPAQEWEEVGEALKQPIIGSPTFVESLRHQPQVPSRPEDPSWLRVQGTTFQPPASGLQLPIPSPERSSRSRVLVAASLAAIVIGVYVAGELSVQRDTRVLALKYQRLLDGGGRGLLPGIAQAHLASRQPIQLAGTVWDVRIRSLDGSRDSFKERLQFQQDRVVIGEKPEGAARRYTFTPQSDGGAVWETIQAGQGGALLSWRGTWRGEVMLGTIVRQEPGQSQVTFEFIAHPHLADGEVSDTAREL